MSSRGKKKAERNIISTIFHITDGELARALKLLNAAEFNEIMTVLEKNDRIDLIQKINACCGVSGGGEYLF